MGDLVTDERFSTESDYGSDRNGTELEPNLNPISCQNEPKWTNQIFPRLKPNRT